MAVEQLRHGGRAHGFGRATGEAFDELVYAVDDRSVVSLDEPVGVEEQARAARNQYADVVACGVAAPPAKFPRHSRMGVIGAGEWPKRMPAGLGEQAGWA